MLTLFLANNQRWISPFVSSFDLMSVSVLDAGVLWHGCWKMSFSFEVRSSVSPDVCVYVLLENLLLLFKALFCPGVIQDLKVEYWILLALIMVFMQALILSTYQRVLGLYNSLFCSVVEAVMNDIGWKGLASLVPVIKRKRWTDEASRGFSAIHSPHVCPL